MFKLCTKCKIDKEFKEFYKDKRGVFGLRAECKDCRQEYEKHRYLNNREVLRSKNNEYGRSSIGKELGRLRRSKRRSLIENTDDKTVSLESIELLLTLQGNMCNYCKMDISNRNSRHLDHIHPISKGGMHSIYNVQWLCCKCNLQKSNKLVL